MQPHLFTTAAVHLDIIFSFLDNDADIVRCILSKYAHQRLASWRLGRLQALQWWPLRLEGASPEAKELQLNSFGLRTLQHLPDGWGVALRRLHARFHAVNPSPSVFDASLEARRRPERRVRRPKPDGGDGDCDDSDDECSDDEANPPKGEDAVDHQHREPASQSRATEYLIDQLRRSEDDSELLEFAERLAVSSWNVCHPGDASESFDWMVQWLFVKDMESWLGSLGSLAQTGPSSAPSAPLLRLMLFGIMLHYQRDAPWTHEWQQHQYCNMVPVYAYPVLSRIVSRLPIFREQGQFLSLVVSALVFADGHMGAGFTNVSLSLILHKSDETTSGTETRMAAFVANLPACIDTYWREFSRHKAYRMWIEDKVSESAEWNAFDEWFDCGDQDQQQLAARFPIVVRGEFWSRWQLWLKLAQEVFPGNEWMTWVGADNTAHRPDLSRPCVIRHLDGAIEEDFLKSDMHAADDDDLVGYPYATTEEERAVAFAKRIRKSSTREPVRIRRFAWKGNGDDVQIHEIDDLLLVAHVVPDAFETIDTYMEWTDEDTNGVKHKLRLRLGDVFYTCHGKPYDDKKKTKKKGDRGDPRMSQQVSIVDWDRCLSMQFHKTDLPESGDHTLYFEFLEPNDAWCKHEERAERVHRRF